MSLGERGIEVHRISVGLHRVCGTVEGSPEMTEPAMKLRITALQLASLSEAFCRFVELSGFEQGRTKIAQNHRVRSGHFERASIGRNRFVPPADGAERVTEVVQCRGMIRLERQSSLHQIDAGLDLP